MMVCNLSTYRGPGIGAPVLSFGGIGKKHIHISVNQFNFINLGYVTLTQTIIYGSTPTRLQADQ